MPMNRRRFIATTSAAAAAFSLPAQAAKKETLNIYCWSEYIPQSVIDAFSKQAKVKVTVENYASNEEMMAKLQAGSVKYDLIQPSEYIIEELIKAGKLEELNAANIPNVKNLDPKFTKMQHDPEGTLPLVMFDKVRRVNPSLNAISAVLIVATIALVLVSEWLKRPERSSPTIK